MNKKFSLIMISMIVIGLLAACSPTAPEKERTMGVSGTGRVTVVPDIAAINIGVRSEAENVTDALDTNTAQASRISRALQELGIEEDDIQTSNFNVYPSDRYDPMTGQVEGRYFVVENTVNVTVRDLTSLGAVLTAVVEAGANNIYGINFDVEDREAAVAEARKLAIEDAKAKAQDIAEESGVELGEIISISVYSGSTPTIYYDAKGGAYSEAAVPIAAGTLSITMEASLTYSIK
ncbi:MAG: SIMPL domain-containing protein [Brevefilum sp.]|nr:SIMPL domain-containing protein [Brevefilum sp.]MDT8380964.1 SIMPL domain-containing protein [Brevefilum sp.]MDW7754369.1 SIMPL domain-containing protein [Brevefilum sp.]